MRSHPIPACICRGRWRRGYDLADSSTPVACRGGNRQSNFQPPAAACRSIQLGAPPLSISRGLELIMCGNCVRASFSKQSQSACANGIDRSISFGNGAAPLTTTRMSPRPFGPIPLVSTSKAVCVHALGGSVIWSVRWTCAMHGSKAAWLDRSYYWLIHAVLNASIKSIDRVTDHRSIRRGLRPTSPRAAHALVAVACFLSPSSARRLPWSTPPPPSSTPRPPPSSKPQSSHALVAACFRSPPSTPCPRLRAPMSLTSLGRRRCGRAAPTSPMTSSRSRPQ